MEVSGRRERRSRLTTGALEDEQHTYRRIDVGYELKREHGRETGLGYGGDEDNA